MYENYKKLGSLTEFGVFDFLYREAVKLTASTYNFYFVPDKSAIERAYNRFIKLYVPLTEHTDYTDERVLTLTVALCIQAAAAFPIVWNGGSLTKGNVQSQYDGLAMRYATELAALSFGILIFSVESSRVLRNEGYYSSNYVELKFLDFAIISKAVNVIAGTRAVPAGKPDYRKSFWLLMRIFKRTLEYKISSGRIAKPK